MKVNFIIKGKNNPTNIICRFKPTQINDFTCTTGIWIKREDWNNSKQQLRIKASNLNKDLINSRLKELESLILDTWINDLLNKENITKDWLKNVVSSFFGKTSSNKLHKIYFIDWVKKFTEESPKRLYKGKPITEKTIQNYKIVLLRLQKFEEHTKTKLRFENINLSFCRDFILYCREVENLNNNSIGSYFARIKMFCKIIEIEGLPISSQYKHSEFTITGNKTYDTYLNEKEIFIIYNHDFSNSERLDNIRDLFIIGLRTGLRISDFLKLKITNIKDGFFEIETIKTGEFVKIPIHDQVQRILLKRNGNFPYSISEQKFNKHVKEVCATVGINDMIEGAKTVKVVVKEKTEEFIEEVIYRKQIGIYPKYELISSHTCRRSFATNLYGKIPNRTIMAITGHRSEKVFESYIKTTKHEHAEKLKSLWEIH